MRVQAVGRGTAVRPRRSPAPSVLSPRGIRVLATALCLLVLPVLIGLYAYVVYPLAVLVLAAGHPPGTMPTDPLEWPEITITLPVYNEERVIRDRIENLLALDYPPDRRHLLVLSDASTDRTDAIVGEYADRGVELVRLPVRAGKSAVENAAAGHLRGSIVVNADATTIIYPQSLKSLVRAFNDPTVGVASGRDVSVAAAAVEAGGGESGYVGYEMWLRGLETRAGGIVGASGCFYGTRAALYQGEFPLRLSRDFASALIAHEHGYRAISVDEALCGVPRVPVLQAEYRRKIRTMHRGLETLWYKRRLLNVFTHGRFAFKLLSHKLARWLVYPAMIPASLGLVLLVLAWPPAIALLLLAISILVLGLIALRWPAGRPLPRALALPGFLVATILAGIFAWIETVLGGGDAIWEPTRRTT